MITLNSSRVFCSFDKRCVMSFVYFLSLFYSEFFVKYCSFKKLLNSGKKSYHKVFYPVYHRKQQQHTALYSFFSFSASFLFPPLSIFFVCVKRYILDFFSFIIISIFNSKVHTKLYQPVSKSTSES